MKKITDWINTIMEDVVDPRNQLKDILLKMVVLGSKMNNQKIKDWVDSELNGYAGKEIPVYREIPSLVMGNLIQDRGFGGIVQRANMVLPIELLGEDAEVFRTIKISNGVAELEKMISNDEEYSLPLPKFFNAHMSSKLSNRWFVDSAWQPINKTYIDGILSNIRHNLLKFLLELSNEVGNDDDFTIMQKNKNVEKSFEKTIGTINGQTVHVSIGNDNMQTSNSGGNAQLNVAKGKRITQNISTETKNELEHLLSEITNNIDKLNLATQDKQDILNEINRINSQINRDNPNTTIVGSGLNVIYQLMLGVASNAYTPVILEKLQHLIAHF